MPVAFKIDVHEKCSFFRLYTDLESFLYNNDFHVSGFFHPVESWHNHGYVFKVLLHDLQPISVEHEFQISKSITISVI